MTTTTTTVASRRTGFGFRMDSMTWAHWTVAALAAITGTIHGYLYLDEGFVPFLFAAVVFYGAIVGMLLNVYRRALYVLGVPFTAGQIVLWYLQGMPTFEIGVVDKVVQAALIVLLIYLFRTER
jgi:hypothetical protein